VKDYSGYVSYVTGIPEVRASGAEGELRIIRPNALLKRLHDNGIYVIARVSVFQDPILAHARPELALRHASSGEIWEDRKGLAWMDPASREVWDYNVAIARDAYDRGFDEINFDYIRFASDGDLDAIQYPIWDEVTYKSTVISAFFKYLREELPEAIISADLFGLTTVNRGDLGIGQVIESAYRYFDYVCPMVYPSHYASGFLGFANPAEHPYDVVRYSMDAALWKFERMQEETVPREIKTVTGSGEATSTVVYEPRYEHISAKLRPWLQDFDLGATYDADKVRMQIQAVDDALANGSTTDRYAGWLLWDPSNVYTETALQSSLP
jgi:hypothetical protein